ncbi:MAG TPA: DUF4258 domain-containing protein [Ignavibacteriaceae bacterium]|nr:DUF4258 domain-containing protein [Ignavibacteriaceae bacterium]
MLDKIKIAAKKRILYSPHALTQSISPDRMITPAEIRSIIDSGEIIEDYPFDDRGHTVLISGMSSEKRHLHVVCIPTDFYLMIITAYIPSDIKWSADFRNREDIWSV